MSLLDKMIERTGKHPAPNSGIAKILFRKGVNRSREFLRIQALPRRKMDLSTITDMTPHFAVPRANCSGCDLCRSGPPTLWPIQSAVLIEAYDERGAIGPIGVGHGKTGISLLLPTALGAARPVLLVPPQTRAQLLERDIPIWSRHYLVSPTINVVAYSQLSIEKYAHILDQLQPDLIIADEAHNLRHRGSARTKRFLRYMRQHPECALVALSGTLTTRSLRDYAHLAEFALHARSPLPTTYGDIEDWAAALDVCGNDQLPMPPGVLLEFCNQAEMEIARQRGRSQEAARRGFRRRLTETRGVVATDEGALGTSLVVRSRRPRTPDVVLEALKELRRTWRLGTEELEDATAVARSARQLACGFYYVWNWPNNTPDEEWLAARAAWHTTMRTYLNHHARAGLDSPALIASAAARYAEGVGDFSYGQREWAAWAAVKDRPKPPTTPIWLDKFLVKDVLLWVAAQREKQHNGIIWTEHQAMEQALRAAGLPTFGGGSDSALLHTDAIKTPFIVASIRAHGTGKNLQAWSRNLITSPPANGTTWEQLLGRTHRPGQLADEVYAEVYLHTPENHQAVESALADARYIETTTNTKQKLLYATRLL